MPVLHDYKCTQCVHQEPDSISEIITCPICGGTMIRYYGNWRTVEFDARKDSRTDAKGYIKQFSAMDDPLCMANMGLAEGRLTEFSKVAPDKQKEFQEKLKLDGDSPKLRREVLREYNKAVGGKYDLAE